MGTIKNIFRAHGPAYLARYGERMPTGHKKVIRDIINCKTDVFGVCVYTCRDCGFTDYIPISCGNRHCPNCQYRKTRKWLERQQQRCLPGPHFMITFTVPAQLRAFIRSHQKKAYPAMFAASSRALKKMAKDPRHIGGDLPGFYGVLHTWGRQMQFHPHIHFVVAGCAFSKKDMVCHPVKNNFYLPIIPLGTIYKAKFRELMKKAGLLDQIPPSAWEPAWNVNCQAVGESDEHANQYLATYVFKVAITDSRVKTDNKAVFVTYKKQKSNRPRTMQLTPFEFIRRFLQHVLPKGFMKIRYYGFMHPSCALELDKLRMLVSLAFRIKVIISAATPGAAPDPLPEPVCKRCGGTLVFKHVMVPVPSGTGGMPSG